MRFSATDMIPCGITRAGHQMNADASYMITAMAIPKSEQVRIICEQAGITAAQARLALDSVVGIVAAGLVRDERVVIHGLGTFDIRRRSPRRVINPATGVMMDLPAKRVVKFKPAGELARRVEEAD